MQSKPLVLLFSLLCIITLIIANEDTLIIEAEDKAIAKILETEDSIATRSRKSLDKEKLSAVLTIITTVVLIEVVDTPADFSGVKQVVVGGPFRTLGGEIKEIKDGGVVKVDVTYILADGTTTFESIPTGVLTDNLKNQRVGVKYSVVAFDKRGGSNSENPHTGTFQ